jgi:hypothetical protein
VILQLLSIAASEAGYDDISEPEDGLISNEDDVADLVDRARGELGAVIRNADQTTRGSGKYLSAVRISVSTATLPSQNSNKEMKIFYAGYATMTPRPSYTVANTK